MNDGGGGKEDGKEGGQTIIKQASSPKPERAALLCWGGRLTNILSVPKQDRILNLEAIGTLLTRILSK